MLRHLLAAFLLVLATSGCAYDPVVTDYAPATDFSRLDSYAWLPDAERKPVDPVADNSLLAERVRPAVDQALESRGFRPAATGQPASFLVSYLASAGTRADVHATPAVGGLHPWGGWVVADDVWLSEYQTLTLVVDVLDPSSRRLLWRGSLEARFDERMSPAQRSERIYQMVSQVLAKFPPGRAP